MTFIAYATQPDMESTPWGGELVTLTNLDDPQASSINAQVLGQALQDGAAEIDSYLQDRYDLAELHALDPVPRVLTLHNRVIARKLLDAIAPRDAVINDYRATIRFLERLQAGLGSLGIETPTEGASGNPIFTQVEPVFSKATLADYGTF